MRQGRDGARRRSLGARQSKVGVSYSIHPDAEAELGDAAVYYATHVSGMIARSLPGRI